MRSTTFHRLLQWIASKTGQTIQKFAISNGQVAFLGILLGLFAGWSASATLGATQKSRIDLVLFSLIFIILPAISLCIVLISIFLQRKLANLSHLLTFSGIGFGLGGISSLVLTYLHQQVSIEINTTFPEIINENSVNYFVNLISTPFRFLFKDFSSEELVQGIINNTSLSHTRAQLITWRNLLLMSIFTYTITPRFVLVVLVNFRPSLRKKLEPKSVEKAFEIPERDKNQSIGEILTLNQEEFRLLVSLQAFLIKADINHEQDIGQKTKKAKWYAEWQKHISPILKGQINADKKVLENTLSDLGKLGDPTRRVILFEALLFQSYFQLHKDSKYIQLRLNVKHHEILIRSFAKKAQVNFDSLLKAQQTYRQQLKKHTPVNIWQRLVFALGGAAVFALVGWFAAPIIGTFIGAHFGLFGAAAKLAGIAALGGGAIILGGHGVAGGIVLLVGGGAIIGFGSAGVAAIYLLPSGARLVAHDIAKLEAVIWNIMSDMILDPLPEIEKHLNSLYDKLVREKSIIETMLTLSKEDKSKLEEIDKSEKVIKKYLTEINEDYLNAK